MRLFRKKEDYPVEAQVVQTFATTDGRTFYDKEVADQHQQLLNKQYDAIEVFENASKFQNQDFWMLCEGFQDEHLSDNIFANFVKIENNDQANQIAEYLFEGWKEHDPVAFSHCWTKLLSNVGRLVYVVEFAYDLYGQGPGMVFTLEELKSKVDNLSSELETIMNESGELE